MQPTPPLTHLDDALDAIGTPVDPGSPPGLTGIRWPSPSAKGSGSDGDSHSALVAIAVGSGLVVFMLVATLIASLAVGFARHRRLKDSRRRHRLLLTSAMVGEAGGGTSMAASGPSSMSAAVALDDGPINIIAGGGIGRRSASKNLHGTGIDMHGSVSSGTWLDRHDAFLMQV